jgi:GT2 family glycosyltransferase/2-polyprenyl-3-methyl-5-hydroxy-6-metoxy-1,4-benzoquinol methylase
MPPRKNLALVNPSPGTRFGSADYGPEYYEKHLGPPYNRQRPEWLEFFGRIADEIIERLNPKSILDVGCAKGFLVECFRDRGVDAYGFDISDYAIGEVRADVKPYCWVASALDPITGYYDLITCIEVCEHLSEEDGRAAIRNMTSHASAVLFSSTPSDFDEPTHINVKPLIYWLRLFREFSFAPDLSFNGDFLTPQTVLFRRVQGEISDAVLRLLAKSKRDATLLANRRNEIDRLKEELKTANRDLALKGQLWETSSHLSEQKDRELASEKARSAEVDETLQRRTEELAATTATLNSVLNSKGWRLLNRYRNLRAKARANPLIRRIVRPVFNRIHHIPDIQSDYEQWIEKYEKPSLRPELIEQAIAGFAERPKISLVMPVYNPPPNLLDAAIASVRAQLYSDWELCVCDDASTNPLIRAALSEWAEKDPRIKVVFSEHNEGISAASNRALALATGDFVGLLDHDDEISSNALLEVVRLLQQHPDADMVYSDEDKLDSDGKRRDPFFKPDWSPEYFLSCMYTCHFAVYRKTLLDEIGGFRRGFEGSQDYDLVLRLTEKTSNIYHIPKILYHWRMAPGSVASVSESKPYAYIAAKRAISEHLQRRKISAQVLDGNWLGHYRLRFAIDPSARVSIIIPSRDKVELLRACIHSIDSKSTFRNYEILIVDNNSSDPVALKYLSSTPHRVVPFREPFSFSRMMNFAAREAQGNYLLLLNNDTQVITPEWMEIMLGYCQQKEIGAVGAKLLFPSGKIQHSGVVLGIGGVAGHALKGFPSDTRHQFGLPGNARNYSAVTAACMLVRKAVFEEVGGFDEELAIAYNDVDFCLRVRQAGYRIVCAPDAQLYHYESASRGYPKYEREYDLMKERWGEALRQDPYYNPNLTLDREDFGIRT